jgi:hypothetical protein
MILLASRDWMRTADRYRFDWTRGDDCASSRVVLVTPPQNQPIISYPAKRFAAGALFCPDCRVRLEEPVPICLSCGFSGERTLELFPGGAPPMKVWMDQASAWDESSRRKVERWLSRLRNRLPQVHWCLLSIRLPAEVRLRLFNFWFFNVSPLGEAEDAEQRGWTILLTYDPEHERMAITPGYYVEPMLADDDWEDHLTTVKIFKGERGILSGYKEFFAEAEQKLIDASVRMNSINQRSEKGGLV